MLNPTYKHLDDQLRIGPFSLGQWGQLLGAALASLVFAVYLSPLPTQATISISILVAGVPFAVSYAAMGSEVSVAEMAVAGLRFYRRPRLYRPGAGVPAAGYQVNDPAADPTVPEPHGASSGTATPTGPPMWDL